MINQSLAEKILNALFTTSEDATFEGDIADKERALNHEYAKNPGNWQIIIPKYTYKVTSSPNDSGFSLSELSTDPKKRTMITFEKLKDKLEPHQQTSYDEDALTAMESYLYSQFKDDELTYTLENITVTLELGEISTEHDETTGKAPMYPIGITENSINTAIEQIKGTVWTSKTDLNFIQGQFIPSISKLNSDFRNNVLLMDTEYYTTSNATNAKNKTPATLGGYIYSNREIEVPEITYTKFTSQKKTYYITLDAPYWKYASSGRSTRDIELVVTKVTQDPGAKIPGGKIEIKYFSQYPQATGSAFYPNTAYIGLFTDLIINPEDDNNTNGYPSVDGTGFREPPYKNYDDENPQTYQRMNLHRGLFTDGLVFNEIVSTKEEDPNYDQYKGYSYLNNKEIIMFPEVVDPAGWGNISGFGIFEKESPVDGETPYFWGEVTTTPAKEGHVPLFRPEEFQIYLG